MFSRKKLHTILLHVKLILSLFGRDVLPKNKNKCDFLFILGDAHCNLKLNNKYYASSIDPFVEKLQYNNFICIKLLRPFSIICPQSVFGTTFKINRSFLFFKIKKKLYQLCSKIFKNSEKIACAVSRNYYEIILSRLDPACIMGIGLPIELCRAARKMSIPSIEILHAYGLAPVPWGYAQRLSSELPSMLFSMDRVSTKTFKSLKVDEFEVIEIANPWINAFKNNALDKNIYSNWFIDFDKSKFFSKCIVVTLQWGYDGEDDQFSGIIKNGVISEEILKAIKATERTVYWFLRLHPVQRHFPYKTKCLNILKKVIGVNCDYEFATAMPFPVILRYCTGHVTMISTAAYESAAFCVPSLLLCPTLKEGHTNSAMFRDLINGGYAELGELDCDSIVRWAEDSTPKEHPWPLIKGNGELDNFINFFKRSS